MLLFRDIPIQRKLRIVILLTCSAALVVACGALFAFQFYVFRREMERDLSAVAEVIASNSTAVASFQDEETGSELLSALKLKPNITSAAIVMKDGRTLARFGTRPLPALQALPPPGLQRLGSELVFAQPITLDRERLGTLVLLPDYGQQSHELFRFYAGILAVVLTISFLVAVLISWRLERVILGPIRYLAEISRRVAKQDNYALRAQKFTEDEIGSFTDSFNSMLEQIEARDQALRHEIAERKRAEAELQQLHQQLISASRQAGMAEVATGVLHNVGNVLNSVNVSATLLTERLNRARMENLVRATSLLAGREDGLAEFLTQDPKGRVLPNYLTELSRHLLKEQKEALAEVALLARNIEHIKDIVAMQQNYARVAGLIEPLMIEELIDDALRLNADAFERHGVAVVRDFAPIPAVAVDRHKVLQILVNLMRNAKHAMDEGERGEKRLTIQIRQKDEFTAEVRIMDTGVGIAPENLTKIFSHGFTTRKEGHGFGLHSAAVAAQQMGGQLAAQSPGVGCGATFILDLPLASARGTEIQVSEIAAA